MEGFLQTYEDIDVVICENDNRLLALWRRFIRPVRHAGPDGDIIIISFDAVRAALEALMRGEINATFECNPLLGPEVENIIQCIENGETIEKTHYVDETYLILLWIWKLL